MTESAHYGIKKLNDFQHGRQKTEMYLGARSLHTQEIIMYENGIPIIKEVSWVPALYTSIRELLDNSLDEINHGFGDRIDVAYDENKMIFSVQDNGRGIPIAFDKKYNNILATMVLTETKTGRNFDNRAEIAGTNGLGISIVNFCSSWMKAEIWRDNKQFTQKFSEGEDNLKIAAPVIKKKVSTKTGTKISCKLSDKVFSDMTLPNEFIYSRIYEIALCNPLLKFYWNGKRIKVKGTIEKTLFGKEKPITIKIKADGFKSVFYLKPNFHKNNEILHTIVNNIPALNGGIHIETFRKQFYTGLLTALTRQSKKRKLNPNRSDINDGLLIFNVTNMNAPNFDSQTKTRLINEHIGKIIKDALDDNQIYKTILTKNKSWIDEIYARCEHRTQKKDASEIAKLSKKVLRGKVEDLRDATGKDRTKCILFIGEGKSAIAGMINVRDPAIHGGLPLTGKPLNVLEKSDKNVLDNKALSNIMNSVGLQLGLKADRKILRYGKIYVAHDMDHDGFNIGALLVNFFYKYWPELFDANEEPFVHIFMTPFIIAKKGKQKKYWYAKNYKDFDPIKYKGWAITRAKGLGTLQKDDWQYSLTNPELFAIVDDGKMKEALTLIFSGAMADSRKLWIGL